MGEWYIKKDPHGGYDILHCQNTGQDLRIYICQNGYFFFATSSRVVKDCPIILNCPKCNEQVPNYIIFQLSLLDE